MLKGISSLLSPELLKVLAEMGHGDEIVLADANFPGSALARRLLRADGHPIVAVIDAVLPLVPLDSYSDSLIMMQVLPGDTLDPEVEADYMRAVHKYDPGAAPPVRLERNSFYQRAGQAFAVVMTGERRIYGNLILKKGLV